MSYEFDDKNSKNNEKTFLQGSMVGDSFERSNFEAKSSFRVISYKLRIILILLTNSLNYTSLNMAHFFFDAVVDADHA